ncbi:MAG: hypothetical protein AB7O32_08425 [Vicinamibacterales bacterium]
MQVTSTSSQSVYVSLSVSVAAGKAGAAPPSAPTLPGTPDAGADRRAVERGEEGRRHRHDAFRPSTQLRALFERIDTNRDGGIDAAELGTVIDYLKQQDPSAALPAAEEALARLDRNGDGTIGRRELRRALQSRWRERVQEWANSGTAPADRPPVNLPASAPASQPADSPAAPRPTSPVAPPPSSTPIDGVPRLPDGSSQATQGFAITSVTVVVAIRAYSSVARTEEAWPSEGAPQAAPPAPAPAEANLRIG